MGDTGASRLAEALKNHNITVLNLNGNNIEDGGVEGLAMFLENNNSIY
ncbi:hypothetical protein [Rickettsia amblyommatis]